MEKADREKLALQQARITVRQPVEADSDEEEEHIDYSGSSDSDAEEVAADRMTPTADIVFVFAALLLVFWSEPLNTVSAVKLALFGLKQRVYCGSGTEVCLPVCLSGPAAAGAQAGGSC